jgi:hypothetical protein
MNIVGFILSLVAGFFMLIGLIPFIGFLNWFTTVPAAVLGIIFSSIGLSKSKSGLAAAGLTISILVLCVAAFRLFIGGGIF